MIVVYHNANIDAVNWRIYEDNINDNVKYFPIGTKAIDVANKLCQFNLFQTDDPKQIYVVNIDGWKLTDKETKESITELNKIETRVVLAYESATVKNRIFTELNVPVVKATAVTKKSKNSLVHLLLNKAKIQLSFDAEKELIELLPDKIDFIINEIDKLKLMDQSSFTKDEIKQIVFDLGDATVFNIVDSWLNDNKEQTIERLNDLISKNITIQAFIPIFALKLIQIKLFLQAKLKRWSSEIITAKMGLAFWQQSIYSNLKPYDKKLEKINNMIDDLYEFDINVKKQKNIPYTQLVKILFK